MTTAPAAPARPIALVASAALVSMGALVLLGWAAHLSLLTSVLAGAASMKPNTALDFMLVAGGLWCALQAGPAARASRWLAGAAAAIAVLTLIEYLWGVDFGIDQLLFPDPETPAFPGRMSPTTAVSFVIAGSAILELRAESLWPSQLGASIVGLLSLVSFSGYLFRAPGLYSVGRYGALALHTTVGFLTLTVGLVCARQHDGLVRLLSQGSAAGHLVRRLLPAAIVLPLVLGWIRLAGQRSGLYGTEFGLALFANATIVAFVSLTIPTAFWIDRADARKRTAEQALQEAARRSSARDAFLAAIVDESVDAIIGATFDGTIQTWNAGAERLFGYRADEAVGRSATMLVPDDRKADMHILRRAADGEHVRAFETVRRRADGSVVDVAVSVSPIRDADGRVTAASVMARDITDRKRAEAALRAVTRFNQQIVQSVNEGIAVLDRNLRFVVFNPAIERLTGLAARDVMGAHPAELFHDVYRRQLLDVLTRALAGAHVVRDVVEPRFAGNPAVQWITDEHVPLISETGEILGVISTMSDITERRQHEHEIERLNRLYAALSQINQTIVREGTREDMLQSACRVLVEYGGFRMAWVGSLDHDTRRLMPVAHWGDADGYVESLRIYTDDRPEGQGPTGSAFREGRPYVCNDFATDPRTSLWRAGARTHGIRAIAVFPVRFDGDVCGTLSVYAGEEGFFQEKEVALLEEAAFDISFALDNLARADERTQAVEALRERENQLSRIVETSPGAILSFRLAPDGTSTMPFASPHVREMFGFDIEPAALAASASVVLSRIHPDDLPAMEQEMAESARLLRPARSEYRILHPQKGQIWGLSHFIPSREAGNRTSWRHSSRSDGTTPFCLRPAGESQRHETP